MSEDLKLYTVHQVADMLNMHFTTVRRYIKNGDLKAFKLGTKYLIKQEDYETFISNQETNKEAL